MKEIISQLSAEFERMEKENITLKKELDGLKAKQQTHNLWAASPLSVMLNHRLEAASFSLMARKTPEDMSWRQIKEICDSGLAQMMFRLGDQKTVKLKNGVTIKVQIIGFYHDLDKHDVPVPITWELVDFWPDRQVMNHKMTNLTSWKDSFMRKWLHGDVRNLLPDDLVEVITPVVKYTCEGGDNEKPKMIETVDSLFLLSEQEIFGRKIYSNGGEGHWYELYRQEDFSYAKKYPDGERGWRWERSPYSGNPNYFCGVNGSGSAGIGVASDSYGVSFGFCV